MNEQDAPHDQRYSRRCGVHESHCAATECTCNTSLVSRVSEPENGAEQIGAQP